MAKLSKSHWYSTFLLVVVALSGLVFLGYRLGKTAAVSAIDGVSLTLAVRTEQPSCNLVFSGQGPANTPVTMVFQSPTVFTPVVLTSDVTGMYTYSVNPNDMTDPHYLAPGSYTASAFINPVPPAITPTFSNPVVFVVTPGPCVPTPTITPIPTLTLTPMPTETLTPVPTLTTVPSPTPALIGICHWNNGSKHWNVLSVSIDNPGHAKHTKDFVYTGPRDIRGNPAKDNLHKDDQKRDGDAWCDGVLDEGHGDGDHKDDRKDDRR